MVSRCFLCPGKPATLKDNNSKRCTKCGAYYHPSCSTRGNPNSYGVFAACCGKKTQTRGSISHNSDVSASLNSVEDSAEEDFNSLDSNSKILFKLLNKKFDTLENRIVNNFNERFTDIEDRLDELEENYFSIMDKTIQEISDRQYREKNVIILNFQDSKNAATKDFGKVVNLLSAFDPAPAFNVNNIVVSRLGNKYIENKTRPLKITLPSKDDIHWFFKNKKFIGDGKLVIVGDLTKHQRDYRQKVKEDLNKRIANGEKGLYIKYYKGVPTIFVNEDQDDVQA